MDKIPLLDLKAQHSAIKNEINQAVAGVLDKTNFILGDDVLKFEEEAARYNKVKFAVGVANGTDAILLSLKALGIGRDDQVITPSFTYFATVGAIVRAGAEPVFVDIDAKTYNIDSAKIEEAIAKNKNIKAIVPVHLYGQMADMKSIKEIAQKYNLKVVEDAAQAFGAQQDNFNAGSIADCGTFSFYPGKNLGADGDGGMILTNDAQIDEKLRILRNQGNKERYYHTALGYNSRLDTIQAAILRVKLKYIDSWNAKRVEHASYYNEKLSKLGITTPFIPEGNTHIYHQYVIRIEKDKDALMEFLRKNSIDARTYYPVPLHLQPCFDYLKYKNGDLPESEKAATQTLAIPVYPELTKDQQGFVIDKIKEFLG